MDKDKAATGLAIMEEMAPIAYKFIEAGGPDGVIPVIESIVWLASLIAAEYDMPIEDFCFMARKCYKFNKAQQHPSDGEQIH